MSANRQSKTQNPNSPSVIFAGGGSGGHISPGLAIAERLSEIRPGSKSMFVCSQRPIDATMLSDAEVPFKPVPASPPSVKPTGAIRFLRNFAASKKIVRGVIRDEGVTHVVALGGFVAAPVVSAAASMGLPIILVNLDAPPGKANQWMAKRCTSVISAIALPQMPGFAGAVVGMPIRRGTLAPADQAACRAKLGLDQAKSTLLVTGASQGATSVNTFIAAFAAAEPALFKSWQIHHLTGHGADEPVRAAYAAAGVTALVEPFRNRMGLAWGAADLAVSRAGASSVAEAAANFVPTLFLPYPYHHDMHQKHNAQPLVDAGAAAMCIDLIDAAANVREVGPALKGLMADSAKRAAMRERLRTNPPPDAALTIAKMLCSAAD